MRRSNAFIPATRESRRSGTDTARLLRRAGLIREFGSGLWGLTLTGQRVRRKIIRRLRTGMEALGGQEVRLPGLQYREHWEASGRWESFEDEMFTLSNRDDQDMCLAPSHEEGMVHLVEGQVRSYDDLPLLLFQIASKFRDDHARNGLVRCKEFTMKDAYSFHLDERSLDATYRAIRDVYASILTDVGLDFAIVDAHNSVMGGSRSEEFVAPVENGSDDLVYCQDCRFGVTDEHEAYNRHGAGRDCPECGGHLAASEGIEVGHVFKLGTRYADAMDLRVDTRTGEERAVRMGSYGIGVERLLQTVVQQHADEDGLRWPVTEWGSIAPFRASIVPIGDSVDVRQAADDLYERCGGSDLLWFDDETQSTGERFAESDLLGIPAKLVLGNRFRETGLVELETRDGENRHLDALAVPEAVRTFGAESPEASGLE